MVRSSVAPSVCIEERWTRNVDGIRTCEQTVGLSGRITGHHGRVTTTPAWPSQGPPNRDELATWSTAELADDTLGTIPALAAAAPDGWTEIVDGRGIFVRRESGPQDETPVWFVHGLGGSSTDWTRLSAALAPRARGYSLDLPGSGRSDPPPSGKYSPRDDADVVSSTIAQVTAGPVHLVGNSYGGVVATLVAARRPDLVRTLAVISPAVPDLRLTRDRGADPRLGLLLVPGTAGLAHRRLASIPPMARARGLGDVCFGHPELITDEDYAAAAAEHTWRADLPWTHASTIGTLRGLMAGYLRPGSSSFAAVAGRVQAPTLVVWGTRDRLVDVRLSRRAAAAYPNAELLVLAECGHVAQMEDPWSTARGILGLWRHEAHRSGSPAGPGLTGRAAPAGSAAYDNLVS